MIHIATNHFSDDRWIDLQLGHLERHTHEPYRVHGALGQIPERHYDRFDDVVDTTGTAMDSARGANGKKLTLLGERIAGEADAEDLLVFMHGDTFPIADWVGPVREMLDEHPLAAVRRDETFEPTPHECFCATTVGFWTEIGGTWMPGPTWNFRGRMVTDTSGSLWANLESRGIEWHPILRTNAVNLHPLWFALYGNIVYHHGAAFRVPMSRLDSTAYMHLPIPLRNFAGVRRRITNAYRSRKIYRRIQRDEDFPLTLAGEGP